MRDHSFLVREYVNKLDLARDFPEERMGVADKSLLARVIRKNAIIFDQAHCSIRTNAFATVVKREMLTWGYHPNIRSECYEYTLQFRRPLNGD